MKIIGRLQLIAVTALLKVVVIFSHGVVKKPLKPADVLVRGSVKAAEFSLGQMDDNNRAAPVRVTAPYTPPNTSPATSAHGTRERRRR